MRQVAIKYHIIYKTTNNVNGKFYIGKHSTNNPHDGYIGSGKALRNALIKYGKENFKCEHLLCALTEDYAYEFEREFVTSDVVASPNTYNMIIGGRGVGSGEDNPNYGKPGPNLGKTPWNKGIPISESQRLKLISKMKGKLPWNTGLSHSTESKAKMSKSAKGRLPYNKGQSLTLEESTKRCRYHYDVQLPDISIMRVLNINEFCKNNNLSRSTLERGKSTNGFRLIAKFQAGSY